MTCSQYTNRKWTGPGEAEGALVSCVVWIMDVCESSFITKSFATTLGIRVLVIKEKKTQLTEKRATSNR